MADPGAGTHLFTPGKSTSYRFYQQPTGQYPAFMGRLSFKKTDKQQNKNNTDLAPFKALGLGTIVNFVGLPFALPYFAALDQFLKANLAMPDSMQILIGVFLINDAITYFLTGKGLVCGP